VDRRVYDVRGVMGVQKSDSRIGRVRDVMTLQSDMAQGCEEFTQR
jgi:hypothetical protein